jgi:hypothetical protein
MSIHLCVRSIARLRRTSRPAIPNREFSNGGADRESKLMPHCGGGQNVLRCGVGLDLRSLRSGCADYLCDQVRLFSIAKRTSSADVRTPSFWRMIEDVLAIVL